MTLPERPRIGGRRRSGLLLHPTALPGPHGIGELGPGAAAFVRFLRAADQSLWQVLPLGPTGFGDSPYQPLSGFAGNPLLVGLESLRAEGLLEEGDLGGAPPEGAIDFERVVPRKWAALRAASSRFPARASAARQRAYQEFRQDQGGWLEDWALFAALKERAGGAAWWGWEPGARDRKPDALRAARGDLAAEIEAHAVVQFLFQEQWLRLREQAREEGVLLLGDLPLYASLDSAEVWARRELFQLAPDGNPEAVAGVPPDYFSATGQLWGNPLYRWDEMARSGFRFFAGRLSRSLQLVDALRLDHFRGLEAYWSVPAGAPSAAEGHWVAGPGAPLLEALRGAVGDPLPLVAENLGVITPEVESLRSTYGLPGMAILQFAFGDDPQAESFLPHNHERSLVVYTGTHDNDTVAGWWASEGGDSTRTPEQIAREKAHARDYLATDGREMHWTMIRSALASVADTCVVPLQDLLGLGSEARFNRPGTATGNWRWRVRREALAPELAERLGELTALYGRSASPGSRRSSNQ